MFKFGFRPKCMQFLEIIQKYTYRHVMIMVMNVV